MSPSKTSYPADTLMWNAKGFLNRIEKLNEGEGVSGGDKQRGDDTTTNERDENVRPLYLRIDARILNLAVIHMHAL